MMSLMAIVAYVAFALVTAALVWAVRELTAEPANSQKWEAGKNPHRWRI